MGDPHRRGRLGDLQGGRGARVVGGLSQVDQRRVLELLERGDVRRLGDGPVKDLDAPWTRCRRDSRSAGVPVTAPAATRTAFREKSPSWTRCETGPRFVLVSPSRTSTPRGLAAGQHVRGALRVDDRQASEPGQGPARHRLVVFRASTPAPRGKGSGRSTGRAAHVRGSFRPPSDAKTDFFGGVEFRVGRRTCKNRRVLWGAHPDTTDGEGPLRACGGRRSQPRSSRSAALPAPAGCFGRTR